MAENKGPKSEFDPRAFKADRIVATSAVPFDKPADPPYVHTVDPRQNMAAQATNLANSLAEAKLQQNLIEPSGGRVHMEMLNAAGAVLGEADCGIMKNGVLSEMTGAKRIGSFCEFKPPKGPK